MDRRAIAPDDRAAATATIIARLAGGESLAVICAARDLPDRRTVQRWCAEDRDLAEQMLEAREAGFQDRAERAVEAAKTAKDPLLGRLAFDAERWYLGKLSIAFAERAPRIESQTNIQVNADGNPLERIAEFMDRAAASISSGANSTYRVVDQSEAGSGST